MLLRDPEHLPDQLRSIAQILLDELATDNAQKGGGGLVGHSLRKERLPRARYPVQDDTLGRLDAYVLVQLGVRQGKLDGLLDFLDLVLQATDVSISLQGCLVHLHDADEGIYLVT